MEEKFKKGEIVSATRTFNGEIITGEFLGYHLFNDENPDTVVGIVDVPGDGVYDVDVTSLRHCVKSTRYSDDEKIRNEIIDFFRGAANGQTKVISGANSLMWADWLEKQKEQKPVGDGTREKIISRATSEKQVVLVSESDGNAEIGWDTRSLEDAKNLLEYGISFIYKQLGVKPAECIKIEELAEHIKAEFESFRNLLKKKGIDYQPAKIYWTDFARLFISSAKKLQKPAEWSEEDKAMLAKAEQIVLKHWNSLSDSFYHKYDDENQDAESCYNWLKSLHGRFGLQPKHEWSEEDEEMRNLIITIFEVNHPDGFFKANELGTTDMRGVHTEEIISWLKSLSSNLKKKNEDVAKLCSNEWSEEDEKHINSIFSDFKQNVIPDEEDQEWLKNRFKSLCPQPKQEWSEEDEKMLQHLLDCLRNGWTKLPTDILMYESWLKSLRPQPSQEWSKEDEVMLNAAIEMVENSNTVFCFEINKYKVSNWLKSIRPKPKKEWSKEDEKILNAIISVLKEINSQPLKRLEDWDGYIRFLESIRPQWKPSEGQMKNFPKWKKADRDWDAGTIDFAVFHKNDGGDHEDWFSVEVTNRLYKGEYYIELSDLDKLPKEE